jgi:hypothetical protein
LIESRRRVEPSALMDAELTELVPAS